jgi:prefoldin subunit 5
LVGAYEILEKTVDDDKAIRALKVEEQRLVARREAASSKIQRWYRKWKQVRNQLVLSKITQAAAAKQPTQKGKKGGKVKKGKK